MVGRTRVEGEAAARYRLTVNPSDKSHIPSGWHFPVKVPPDRTRQILSVGFPTHVANLFQESNPHLDQRGDVFPFRPANLYL